LGTCEKGEHVPWFAHFLAPKRFILLVIGGTLEIGSSLYVGLIRNDRIALLSLLSLTIFLISAAYFYNEANNLLRKMNIILSKEDSPLWSLFMEQTKFDNFIQSVRGIVFNAKEYFIVFGIPIILTPLGFYQLLMQPKNLVDSARSAYFLLYWGVVFTICLSLAWAILGFSISLNRLGKEKENLEISRSLQEFKKLVHFYKDKSAKTFDFGTVDFSFGKLKEAISPLADFLYTLSLKIAVFGFLFSTPQILEYALTGSIYNLTYASSCVFTGFLSVIVFAFAQEGMSKIWNSSKDEALLAYEQLCEHIKHMGVGSIVSSRNPHAREKLEKDAAFVRNTIDDLKRLEATKFNVSSITKVSISIFLPLITVVFSRLIK
jgi:hypothetical protein